MKQTAVFTGAAGGIGLPPAGRLEPQGYRVIGPDKNVPDNFPGEFRQGDLLQQDALADTMETVIARHGQDGLINNAAANQFQSIYEITQEMFFRILTVNTWVPVYLSQLAARHFRQHRIAGRIINIASIALRGLVRRGSYATSKGPCRALPALLRWSSSSWVSRSTPSRPA